MSTAKLTLIGLDNYLAYDNKSIFDKMVLPDEIDREVLIDNIKLRSIDFEVMYPDAYLMTDAIGVWSRKWAHTFERWVKALSVDYEPLYNYDRTEEWSTVEDIDDAGTHTETNISTGTDSTESSADNTTTEKVSAYNNNTLVDNKQSISDTGSESSSESHMSVNRTGNDTNNRNRSETRKGRAYGNIGVTTSQQMLESELDIAKWNIYEHITDIFLSEFIIPVF